MRLVTFQGQSGPAIGVRLGDKVIDLSKAAPDLPIDMIGLLEGGESSLAKAKAAANNAADDAKVDMSSVKLLYPSRVREKSSVLAVTMQRMQQKAGQKHQPTQKFFTGDQPH